MKLKLCGVYKILNIITGDFYIGSTDNIMLRFQRHHKQLAKNEHHSRHLQNAWNKYGEQAFEFTILLLCDIEHKLYFEQVLIDGLKPVYNIATNVTAPMQGRHLSEESRAKIGRAGELHPMFGKHHSAEACAKMSEAKIGCTVTEETKRKMSDAHRGPLSYTFGKHLSEETRRKLSEANMGNTYCLGRHPSEESKRKNSESHKGKPSGGLGRKHSEESKTKMSIAHQGIPLSNITRMKMSEARMGNTNTLGYKHTDEARAKISVSLKAHFTSGRR